VAARERLIKESEMAIHKCQQAGAAIFLAVGVSALCGCQSPSVSKTELMSLDSVKEEGSGIGSYEIRTVASQMAPKILALPEVADAAQPVRIAIAPMKNSSSYPMDMGIFMTRLRAELGQCGGGKVRFFAQDRNSQGQREAVLKEKTEESRERALDEVAAAIAAWPAFKNAQKPVVLAVTPALNANLVSLNADSFVAMLRAKIAERSGGKIRFTLPGELKGADFFLTGQFIADSVKREGMVNLVDYIALLEERLKEGRSLDVYGDGAAELRAVSVGHGTASAAVLTPERRASLLSEIQQSAELREVPDVTKKLNVMLVEASSRTVAFEKMFDIERKSKMGYAKAEFILSGEVSSVSKLADGNDSSYLLVSVQLLDPASNEYVWEGVFELKKKSEMGVVY
jgi:hypothetical protein